MPKYGFFPLRLAGVFSFDGSGFSTGPWCRVPKLCLACLQKKCERAWGRILRAREIDAKVSRYNYCCVLSLRGRHAECLDELRQLLVERPDQKEGIAKDPDFQPVAALPEFRELIAPLEWNPEA